MNERLLELAEALESGQFEQCQNTLSIDGKFCCLGVACKLMARKGLITEIPYLNDLRKFGYGTQSRIELARAGLDSLPQEASEYYGLDHVGRLRPNGTVMALAFNLGVSPNVNGIFSLAQFNDAGATFKQIAEIIRSEPEWIK